MLDFLKDGDKGTDSLDKLRLFLTWYLSIDQDISRNEMEAFEEALKAVGAETESLAYIKQ